MKTYLCLYSIQYRDKDSALSGVVPDNFLLIS